MTPAFRKKIIELFEYRMLPELMIIGGGTLDRSLYEDLINLQYRIYKLDEALEQSYEVDHKLIDARWQDIYLCLSALGIARPLHDDYSKHIYKYQRHELDIRERKLPTRLSMEYFYFYKSCDVKQLRRIIYDKYPVLARSVRLSQWRIFDLVTELNDDIADVQEDVDTVNGNRFLISYVQHGAQLTRQVFGNFLRELDVRNQELPELRIDGYDVKEITAEQINVTLELMESQIAAMSELNLNLYKGLVKRQGREVSSP